MLFEKFTIIWILKDYQISYVLFLVDSFSEWSKKNDSMHRSKICTSYCPKTFLLDNLEDFGVFDLEGESALWNVSEAHIKCLHVGIAF